MVVGMRQTRSATIAVADSATPEYMASGTRVTTAMRNTMVSPTRRICSAISFGVFCRDAPSTSAIIRSRKLEPGSAEIRTMMRSDRTLVPPVTDERSPPDSRMTGADSPVMADSSTEAMPSTTSPSPGMKSPASTTTWSPLRRAEAGTGSVCALSPLTIRWAVVSRRILRRLSAWALPRPSAIASAKLANRTVNHSHAVVQPVNQSGISDPPPTRSRMTSAVVRTLPTSTTNMTGFFIMWRGDSLTTLSITAWRMMPLSKSESSCARADIRTSSPGRSARRSARARPPGRRSALRR